MRAVRAEQISGNETFVAPNYLFRTEKSIANDYDRGARKIHRVFLQRLNSSFSQIFASLVGAMELLCSQCDKRLDADCVENLLQSEYRHGLIFRFLVAADHLLANAEPAGCASRSVLWNCGVR